MIKRYFKNQDQVVGRYFKSKEFDCPCGQCISTYIDDDLVSKLDRFRDLLGIPIRVNSGYRCGYYQQELRLKGYETAVGQSQHELGKAADVMPTSKDLSGQEMETVAREAGFKAVGVASSWIHTDTRADKDRRWTYDRR